MSFDNKGMSELVLNMDVERLEGVNSDCGGEWQT